MARVFLKKHWLSYSICAMAKLIAKLKLKIDSDDLYIGFPKLCIDWFVITNLTRVPERMYEKFYGEAKKIRKLKKIP